MVKRIDGPFYIDILKSGIKNLDRHRKILNDLNVFPVPDGDTGTNMVMTLRHGLEAVKGKAESLSEVSRKFSSAAVFGARGNSGVIVSQFFKGVSEAFDGAVEADCKTFSDALENGCKFAYASVAKPVEGTILTVLNNASRAVANALPLESIDVAIDIFLDQAKVSLENTPELLPILKKANVVDSGGSGIVYFFEGVKKHLGGEPLDDPEEAEEAEESEYVDLSKFNKDTKFEYGYCVEGLIQLTSDADKFDFEVFKAELSKLGNSLVVSLEDDKVKLHIHTKILGRLMECCQRRGEFLTIKIENMTVQNIEKNSTEKEAPKFLFSKGRNQADFAVVAVATNSTMQQKFFDLGADVVIRSDIAPSSQDFMDAFAYADADRILVFPNSSNSVLTATQASKLYKKGKITVLNSRSPAECYASLSVMDFDGTAAEAAALSNETISNLYQLSVYSAVKDMKFENRNICKNDFIAMADNKILDIGETVEAVTLRGVERVLKKHEYNVITVFYGKSVDEDYAEYLVEKIADMDFDVEIAAISTLETAYALTVVFE